MNNESSSPRKYQRYDENFKRSAVELWRQGHRPAAKLCRELGISSQSLKQWKKQLAAAAPTGPGRRSFTFCRFRLVADFQPLAPKTRVVLDWGTCKEVGFLPKSLS